MPIAFNNGAVFRRAERLDFDTVLHDDRPQRVPPTTKETMHTGLSLIFQNLGDRTDDRQMMQRELSLAMRAEEVGLDSLWIPEHHFAGYTVAPSVPQVLSWIAGRTKRLRLGTMVTVLPWHDPVRVVENFSLLDHLSDGRALLGIGRGLGRHEFDGLRLDMGESRRRFTEYTEAVLEALETGYIEHTGELYNQPRVEIRPTPFQTFTNRTFASAISPESMDLMARLKVGLMVIAQKPWETVEAELSAYRDHFYALNGEPAPKPVLSVFVAIHEDAAQAQRLRETYLQATARSISDHYEFANKDFAKIEGYEYYAKLAQNIERHGIEAFSAFLADLQVWGTPDQVTEKLLEYVKRSDAGALLANLSFGGMDDVEARRNFDLYAREVLPVLKQHDVGGDIGVKYAVPAVATAAAT